MINDLKYLLIIALCFVVVGACTATFAQSNGRVLVSGKKQLRQSDVDKLIEFYEWAFETSFTGEHRTLFRQNTEAEFRSDPDAARKTIDDIVVTLPKILAADREVQQKTREVFLAEFIADARKNGDENSRMLVEIYESAHAANIDNGITNNGDHDAPGNESDDSVSGVGNLSALVGEWVWGRSGSMTTTTNGVYLGGNGSRHTYRFSANGSVEYTGIMNVMTGGCRMQVFRSSRGKASLSGDTLTVKWSPASFSRDDSCSPSKNYKKTLPAETEVMQIKFKTEHGEKQLCLTGKDETCYSAAQ